MQKKNVVFTYENGLLLLLGISWGVAYFDRTAGTVLVPFMERDLHLDNTRVSLISAGLSISWALGAYLIARWSDATGARKPFLLSFLAIFSACSFLSGLAQTFPVLLGSRVLMGAVEGPFLPVCLALMMAESSEHRRGVNAGVMQNFFASIFGQFLAPLVLAQVAANVGWRSAFFVAGIPGLLCALGVLAFVREPQKTPRSAAEDATGQRMGLIAMLSVRNVLLCCVISAFMVAWLAMGWAFFPKFFIDDRHFTPAVMSRLLATLGVASAVSAFLVPALSDRFGRKPIMIAFCVLGATAPLAVLYSQGSLIALGMLMFVGWLGCGTFPLFMGVIPGETLPRRYATTAMGLVVGAGEVVGGSGLTLLGGVLADRSSLATPILIQAACAVIGGVLSLFLIETAPIKVGDGAHRSSPVPQS
jgi:MFS family permease